MVIIETPLFVQIIDALMSEEEYRLLQEALVVQPDMGDITKGSGGMRKARWGVKGKGKRGGSRVIYYWVVSQKSDTDAVCL